jgi:hypothetical protein
MKNSIISDELIEDTASACISRSLTVIEFAFVVENIARQNFFYAVLIY